MNPKVDLYMMDGCGRCEFYATPRCKVKKWQAELETLRFIVLSCGLKEELKWGVPCYTFEDSNVLIVAAFKEYCAISFFKGALLRDPQGILVKPGENTQGNRQVRLTSVAQITEMEDVLRKYIFEAAEVEKKGLKVKFKKTSEYEMPEEFQTILDESPALTKAFKELTPGRQREYLIHFSAPKQAKTRESRIEKCIDNILSGVGLNDHYRSKRK